MVAIVSKQSLFEANIARRIARVETNVQLPDEKKIVMLESLKTKVIPRVQFVENFDMSKYIKGGEGLPMGKVAEFIGPKNFDPLWFQRQKFEVDAGRDEEPLIYTSIYSITTDANLPQVFKIYTLGASGVVFNKVRQGGEVQFASIGTGNKNLELFHWAVGLEYLEELFLFNQLWQISNLERQFGIAFNALLNHIHLSPILDFAYGSRNLTDGSALTNFNVTASMPEKYLRAVEAGVQNSVADIVNPRRGRYVILCSTADVFMLSAALKKVPQQGFDQQSDMMGLIDSIIVYDGWTGTRGAETTTYTGVPAGTAFLVDISQRAMDYQSYVKVPLRLKTGNPDVSRFIEAQNIWDSWFGAFADPERTVEKITLPLASSGYDPA